MQRWPELGNDLPVTRENVLEAPDRLPVGITETAVREGTIRAISERTRAKVRQGIGRVAAGVSAAHEVEVIIEFRDGYPVTVDNSGSADFALRVAGDLIGSKQTVRLPNPEMGAEDFSYVLNRVPWAMLFLGGTSSHRNPATAAPNHSNRVLFDEEAMVIGVAVYGAMALRHLIGLPA